VVGDNVSMGDQGFDGSGYGCFLQTCHVGWGGGLTNPNWYSAIAEGLPRLLDFATVATSGALKAISPDLTLAEVNALPDPPAAATSITLVTGLRFVYKTGEGKQRLVKVFNVVSSAGASRFDLFFTAGK